MSRKEHDSDWQNGPRMAENGIEHWGGGQRAYQIRIPAQRPHAPPRCNPARGSHRREAMPSVLANNIWVGSSRKSDLHGEDREFPERSFGAIGYGVSLYERAMGIQACS